MILFLEISSTVDRLEQRVAAVEHLFENQTAENNELLTNVIYLGQLRRSLGHHPRITV